MVSVGKNFKLLTVRGKYRGFGKPYCPGFTSSTYHVIIE